MGSSSEYALAFALNHKEIFIYSLIDPRGALFWRNSTSMNSFLANNLLLNTALDSCLQADHEVIFMYIAMYNVKGYNIPLKTCFRR